VKTMTFEVTPEEANLILAGLSELPAKISLALINKIQQQGQAQMNQAQEQKNV